jgi:hypothetical protein
VVVVVVVVGAAVVVVVVVGAAVVVVVVVLEFSTVVELPPEFTDELTSNILRVRLCAVAIAFIAAPVVGKSITEAK